MSFWKNLLGGKFDRAGYRADFFPRRAEFMIMPGNWMSAEDGSDPDRNREYGNKIDEFERALYICLKKYRYDFPLGAARTFTGFYFGIMVESGSELNTVFSELTALLKPFNVDFERWAYKWSVCKHGRYFHENWEFDAKRRRLETPCVDCINGA